MKKKPIEKLLNVLILFISTLSIISCEINEIEDSSITKMSTENISKKQLLNELNNNKIIEFVSTNKYFTNSNELLKNNQTTFSNSESTIFQKIVKSNEYITYSLRLNSYTSQKPYFKYFVINKEISGIEKAGFVRYTPSNPTYELDVDNFTGDIEIYNTDNELFAKTSFLNGQPIKNNSSKLNNRTSTCYNVNYIVTHPCSHGGNHTPGQSCENGLVNDAYYEIRTTPVCFDDRIKSIVPPDTFGGTGGGGGGATILNLLNVPVPYEGEPSFSNESYMFYHKIYNFLQANPAYNNFVNHQYANSSLVSDWIVPTVVDYFRYHSFDEQHSQINVLNSMNMFTNFLQFESNQFNFEEMLVNKFQTFQLLLQNSQWLSNQSNETTQNIFNYLIQNHLNEQSRMFAGKMINYCIANPLKSDSATTELFFKTLGATNNFKDNLTESFVQDNFSYFSQDVQNQILIDPLLAAQIAQEYLIQRAVKKYLHPNWNEVHIYYSVLWDLRHMALDAFGLIPVIGEVADLANGTLYTIENDKVNAAFSFASAVPVAGWAAVGVKYAVKIKTVATIGTKVKLTWKVLIDGTIYFGTDNTCRAQLRKVLGLAVGNLNQAHHIIPLNLQTNTIVQKAFKSADAFHLNEALNGIPLSKLVHNGSHSNYDGKIFQKLEDFRIANPNASPKQCYDEVVDIINDIRTAIQNSPNTPINQLNF